jgi:hypothetical protein
MGAATIIEGILSSCYHICPTHESFQFDTTFIYIIAILILTKMYQFRHPDLTVTAHSIFAVICFIVFLETLSYYLPIEYYVWFFVLTYLIIFMCVAVKAGWYKTLKEECMSHCKNGKTELDGTFRNKTRISGKRARTSFIIFICFLNLFLLITTSKAGRDGFASNAVMFIFLGNMAGYAIYYQIMKWRYVLLPNNVSFKELLTPKVRNNATKNLKNWIYGVLGCGYGKYSKLVHPESISRAAFIYFWLGMGLMISGGYFFVSKEKTTEVSPSQSLHLNGECLYLFFDNHDLWHLTSGLGLFFIFMWLLTLEDCNTDTHWQKIPVF